MSSFLFPFCIIFLAHYLHSRLLDDLLEDSSENEEAEEVIGEVLDEINLELTKDLEYGSQEVLPFLFLLFSLKYSNFEGDKSWSTSKRTPQYF